MGKIPGITSLSGTNHRIVVLSDAEYLPGGVVIDGSESRDPTNSDVNVLTAGVLMGKRTANDMYAPSIIGLLTNDELSADYLMQCSAATALEVSRRLGATGTLRITGPPSAAGTVASETVTYSAIDTTNGVITIDGPLSADYVAGSWIQPNDGSQTILAIIDNGSGLDVFDEDNNATDIEWSQPVIGGHLDASQIVNYGTETSCQARIKTQLNAVGRFTFDDDF